MIPEGDEVVRYSRSDDSVHLSLHGVVDLFAAANLRELALRALESGHTIRVECRELERIDGSILQLLLALAREVVERGGTLALLNVPEKVCRYLVVAGANCLLTQSAQNRAADDASVRR